MWADELFCDLKSQGFHLERTRLTHTQRLDRLMLALALAYWWGTGTRHLDRPRQTPEVQLVHSGLALNSSSAYIEQTTRCCAHTGTVNRKPVRALRHGSGIPDVNLYWRYTMLV
jgi:hypothetical protein